MIVYALAIKFWNCCTMHLRLTTLIFILIASSMTTPATSKLYRWTDTEGKVHYSDKLPPSQANQARPPLSSGSLAPLPPC